MTGLKRAGQPGGFATLVLFLSGAGALVSEVSWSRQVGLVVGNTAPAAALVLAAYFAGLAAGQALGARLAPRLGALGGYGACELLAAAWACAVPPLLDLVTFPAPPGSAEDAWWARDGIRGAWCFLVLLPATVPLGATFPLMAEHLTHRGGGRGRRVALAYAANTAGGLGGVLAATAFLLVWAGVRASGYLAAGLCAACGAAACVAAVAGRRGHTGATPADTPAPSAGWLALAAVSGFGTLGLEVLYTRMFALVFHNSTYTFGAVVAAFLAALALGAGVVAAVGRRVRPGTLSVAAGGLGAAAVPASVALFVGLTKLEYFAAGDTLPGYLAGVFGLVGAVVLPPVTLLGVALPAAFAAAAQSGGRAVGRLAAANTAAAAVGALAASFLWLPWLGLWGSFALLTVVLGLPPVAALARHRRASPACGLAAVVTAGAAVAVAGPRQPPDREGGRGEEIVRRWDGAYGWIDVVRDRRNGSLKIRENLHYRHGSTGGNAAREYRQGRLPLLLHPRPTEVAFLGLGTGLTAAPAVADRDVGRLVVVELIPEVVEAACLLSAANLGGVGHPKVEVRIDDARHYLSRTGRRFDVVVSDLFVPWESRAGYLYTAEHYAAARRSLRPGGLFCQWVALYQLGPGEFELIADSFAAVFPEATVWWGQFDARYGVVALVGSDAPLVLDPARLDARWDAMGAPPGGPDPDLGSPAALPDLYLGGWSRRPGRRLNTDEHPRLEFAAPASQRAGRTLTGPALRSYFDRVLAGLPPGGVVFEGSLRSAAEPGRRAAQRLSLFGS